MSESAKGYLVGVLIFAAICVAFYGQKRSMSRANSDYSRGYAAAVDSVMLADTMRTLAHGHSDALIWAALAGNRYDVTVYGEKGDTVCVIHQGAAEALAALEALTRACTPPPIPADGGKIYGVRMPSREDVDAARAAILALAKEAGK